jgi:hypothetical protein
MADKNDRLDLLASLTVEALILKIKSGEVTAADLNVARQLLKDNNVQFGEPSKGPLKSLTDALPFTSADDEVDLSIQ